MRKHIAMFVPAVALIAYTAACTDQVTNPGATAGMMPVDTLLARAPIDTMYSAQRAPIDTLARAAMPVDTLY